MLEVVPRDHCCEMKKIEPYWEPIAKTNETRSSDILPGGLSEI